MLRLEQRLDPAAWNPAQHGAEPVVLRLPFESRCRSRLAVRLQDGREAVVMMARGTVLRHHDLLQATDGTLVRVEAEPEAVLRVSASTPLELLRAAYHLGNRHVRVEVQSTRLQLEPDPVLHDMLVALGVTVETLMAPFEPEAGAYGGGHRHGHDESFAEDYALAQAAYASRHGHHAPEASSAHEP